MSSETFRLEAFLEKEEKLDEDTLSPCKYVLCFTDVVRKKVGFAILFTNKNDFVLLIFFEKFKFHFFL